MNYVMFAVKDIVVGSFNAPFVCPNKETAIRSFNESNRNCAHKKDLQLYKIGNFNLTTGQVIEDLEYIGGGADEE